MDPFVGLGRVAHDLLEVEGLESIGEHRFGDLDGVAVAALPCGREFEAEFRDAGSEAFTA